MQFTTDNQPQHSRRGVANGRYTGGIQRSGNGALYVVDYENPRADSRGRVYAHIAVAEAALGKPLPSQAIVHHADQNRHNNQADNLVICQDQSYHLLLHRRTRALKACGHADWFKCRYCKDWSPKSDLYVNLREASGNGPLSYHRHCHAEANAEIARRRKAA